MAKPRIDPGALVTDTTAGVRLSPQTLELLHGLQNETKKSQRQIVADALLFYHNRGRFCCHCGRKIE